MITIDLSGPQGNAFYLIGLGKQIGRQLERPWKQVNEAVNEGILWSSQERTMAKNFEKHTFTREQAIERLMETNADFYWQDPHQAVENYLAVLRTGLKGYDKMTNIELIQELEGSTFYGEDVEITIKKEIGDGEVI
jgi:hypothetical protein